MTGEIDIERRLPVWQALSELFLDTELQPYDHRQIAAQLRESGYSPDELRAILMNEVAPAFVPNLLSVAGEWTSWSEDEVRIIMLRSLASPLSRTIKRWVARWLFGRGLAEDFARIIALMR